MAKDRMVIVQKIHGDWSRVNIATRMTIAPNSPAFSAWRPGSRIGLPPILPLSFRKAMTEPEKVIAPIATPSAISTRLTTWMLAKGCPIIGTTMSAMSKATGLRKAAQATATAARPTSEWKAATSCGIAVIAIRRAVVMPIRAPSPMAARISKAAVQSIIRSWGLPGGQASARRGTCVTSVVTTAIAMPIMPKRLPRWLVVGLDSPRSARMKHTPATR